jgi:hypothetical protein
VLWAGFALPAGCDEVGAAFTLGLFGFPWSRVSSLSSLSFFFSDPSTLVRSARLEFAATVEATSRVSDVVVTNLLDQQDKLSLEGFLLVVEFKFCRGGGCSIDQLTER